MYTVSLQNYVLFSAPEERSVYIIIAALSVNISGQDCKHRFLPEVRGQTFRQSTYRKAKSCALLGLVSTQFNLTQRKVPGRMDLQHFPIFIKTRCSVSFSTGAMSCVRSPNCLNFRIESVGAGDVFEVFTEVEDPLALTALTRVSNRNSQIEVRATRPSTREYMYVCMGSELKEEGRRGSCPRRRPPPPTPPLVAPRSA